MKGMADPRHTLRNFAEALHLLRENILLMGSLAERNLNRAVEGVMKRNQEYCHLAIVDDEEVDLLEKQIDLDGIEIITRFQPLARDLRAVVAAMRISSNLERIADQATSIARRGQKLNQEPAMEESMLLEPMAHKTIALFKESLRAFAEHDCDLAGSLKDRDREIDQINKEIAVSITDAITYNTDNIPNFLSLIFIARNLERVGDHSTNIGEDVVFAELAVDIRHRQSSLGQELQ